MREKFRLVRLTPLHFASRFAAGGALVPLLLWGIIKSREYGLIGGSAGDSIDNWAFQFLIMFAPLFYHIVAILQDQSLTVAYTIAFGTNAALYLGVGVLSTWLLRFPAGYYLFVLLIVVSMLIETDSWFVYRWLNREDSHLPTALNDLELRYFLAAACLVVIFFVAIAREKR